LLARAFRETAVSRTDRLRLILCSLKSRHIEILPRRPDAKHFVQTVRSGFSVYIIGENGDVGPDFYTLAGIDVVQITASNRRHLPANMAAGHVRLLNRQQKSLESGAAR